MRQHTGDAKRRGAETGGITRMQVEPVQHDLFGKNTISPISRLQRGGQWLRRLRGGLSDQRPARIHGLQFNQLPLTGRRNDHRAHLRHVGRGGATVVQPVAECIGQRLGTAIDLQIAA